MFLKTRIVRSSNVLLFISLVFYVICIIDATNQQYLFDNTYSVILNLFDNFNLLESSPFADAESNENNKNKPILPMKLSDLQYHGTTTLGFIFGNDLLIAVDSKASVGAYVGSRTVQKVIPISPYILATMAGGAADCAYWIKRIARQVEIIEYEYMTKLNVYSIAKLLAKSLRDYRGMELSVGTMVGGYNSELKKCQRKW